VYTIEKVISYARRTQQIFVAQCVWWLASIIGFEQGLVNYGDNIQSHIEVTVTSEESPEMSVAVSSQVQPSNIHRVQTEREVSAIPRDLIEDR
jgi:hypothetical protein